MKNYIKRGDELQIEEGMIQIGGYNGHIVTCKLYEYDDIIDEYVLIDDSYKLTLSEIGKGLRFFDGRNHEVFYVREDDVNE